MFKKFFIYAPAMWLVALFCINPVNAEESAQQTQTTSQSPAVQQVAQQTAASSEQVIALKETPKAEKSPATPAVQTASNEPLSDPYADEFADFSQGSTVKVDDPLEILNRRVYCTNQYIDNLLIKPLASFYRDLVPPAGRQKVGNFFINLASPAIIVNSVLQGRPENAMNTFWRFIINSTIGIGGLFDPASKMGIKAKQRDFGQTLGVHGIKNSPYLMIPLFGPSTIRDAAGLIFDSLVNPFNYLETGYIVGARATQLVHTRSENIETINSINAVSLDPYATIRAAYVQRRNNIISEGKKR